MALVQRCHKYRAIASLADNLSVFEEKYQCVLYLKRGKGNNHFSFSLFMWYTLYNAEKDMDTLSDLKRNEKREGEQCISQG